MTKRESSFSGDESPSTPLAKSTPKKSPAKKAKKEVDNATPQAMTGKGILFKCIFEAGLKSFDKAEAATLSGMTATQVSNQSTPGRNNVRKAAMDFAKTLS